MTEPVAVPEVEAIWRAIEALPVEGKTAREFVMDIAELFDRLDVAAIRDTAPGPDAGLRAAVRAYLDHMDKREPYADVHADIRQAGDGGPDFTVDRHFDGDGCFAEMERAALAIPEEERGNVTCLGHCGSLDWTLAEYGAITHKHSCPRRTTSFCQSHRDGCPAPEGIDVPVGDEPDSIRVNGHMFVHVAACPCDRIQAEVSRLDDALGVSHG